MNFELILPTQFPAFVVASLLIEMTPGPNMGFLAVVALGQGRRAGFAVVAGVAVGLLMLGLAGAWGVSEILKNNELAYATLRYAGVAFLLYLAWEGWHGAVGTGETDGGNFLRGFLNNVLNPKAALFYVVVLPEFVDPALPVFAQTLVLTLTYVAIATAIHAAVVIGASAFNRFASNPDREQFVRRFLSMTLAAFAIWFAYSTA